ncbi:MAG: transcriptional regulator [Pseudomonadota bacterium]
MDKRELSKAFRERFRLLLGDMQEDLPTFLKRAKLDRSALSQLRDPKQDRLPRAETLRRIAEATGASVDWLLALENARGGRQEMTQSSELLAVPTDEALSPLARWRAETEGQKLRYVPAVLPDMLSLSDRDGGAEGDEKVLTGFDIEETDLEIAMPFQTLEVMAARKGRWRDTELNVILRQISHIADLCQRHYPALRLHLFDGRKYFSAPFTVFGRMRVSIYVGDAYVSATSAEEVRFFSRRFDELVRHAAVAPDAVPRYARSLLGD